MARTQRIERCIVCDDPTGKAGACEDSLYDEHGTGPFCEECWEQHQAGAQAMTAPTCPTCWGYGEVSRLDTDSEGNTRTYGRFECPTCTPTKPKCEMCGGRNMIEPIGTERPHDCPDCRCWFPCPTCGGVACTPTKPTLIDGEGK
jgi:hypothetical protein